MKLLRLYMLRNAAGEVVRDPHSPTGEPKYFNDKMLARAQRPEGGELTFGPDHWKYRANGTNKADKGGL